MWQRNNFSGCNKEDCSLEINPVYTIDGFIYSNECFANNADKQVKCYINSDDLEMGCGL